MNENVPAVHDYSLIRRSVLADKPRVTRYKIAWEGNGKQEMQQQQGEGVVEMV
jgi:hypothetical protein